MKISTKGRYALRMMLDIAQHDTGEPVRIRDISARQDISVKYLEQIVSILVRAKLLHSIRGPQGGYRLVKRPGEYTVGEILRVTENVLMGSDISDEQVSEGTYSAAEERLWKELDTAIASVIDRFTLEDLLNWSAEAVYNFVI